MHFWRACFLTTMPTEIARSHTAVSRRLFGNTALNFAGQGFVLALNVVTAPYIVHHLGVELFAIVALVQATAGFAGFLNLGIGRALTKYIAELHWKGDIRPINDLFQTAWATCIISGLAACALLLGPKGTIARLFFRTTTEKEAIVVFAIYIAAFGLFSSMLLEAVSSLPAAIQRFDVCNSINVLTGAGRCLGAVAVLASGWSVRGVLVVNLAANLVGVVAFSMIGRKLLPGLSLLPRFHLPAFKRLLHFSLPLLLSSISVLIVTRVDRFILAYFLPLAAVTFYTLPYSLSEKLSLGITNVSNVVYPFTSELHSKGAHKEVQELYVRSNKMLALLTLPVTAVLTAVPGPILRIWLGPEYASQGAVTLSLCALSSYFIAATAVPTVTSLGLGRAWMPTYFSLAASAINLSCNLILIPRYGINGAALGQLVPTAVIAPAFAYVITRALKMSVAHFFAQTFARPLACAAVQCLMLYVCRGYISTLSSLAVIGGLSVGLFIVLSLLFVLAPEERSALFRVPSVAFSRG